MTEKTFTISLIVASLIAIFLACLLGSTSMAPIKVLAGLFGQGTPSETLIIWQIRLPRALAAFLVGAALGMSGAALQGLLRNPLAEPGVLGVSACGSLGAVLALYYGFASWGALVMPIAAILGALGATLIIAALAARTRSMVTLILIGVGLSSFAGAAMSLLLNLAPNPFSLADMLNWMLGSVSNRSLDDIILVLPFMGSGMGLLLLMARGLSALTLGEEAASSIGLDLKRHRLFIVIGTGLATGSAVALAGAIGFVGIIAPHLVRPFVNHDPARSLMPSALLAGLILVLADIGVRLLPTANELKLGVVAALIGAPVFVWIAASRGRHHD